MEPTTTLTAQQRTIQEARARYEQGELSYEAFREALDALVLAQDADECQRILDALPTSPLAPLAALDAAVAPLATPDHKSIVAFMGQTKKMRSPWKLARSTNTVAFMGEVQLDLGRAALPPQATMRVAAIMGTVTLYVPRNLRVTVRSTVLLGDLNALGESTSGVIAFGHEEHSPAIDTPAADLEIEVFLLMGNVKVQLTDGPTVSIREMAQAVLKEALSGVRRGLAQGATPRQSLDAPPTPRTLPGV